jgi:hypothetical protein
MKLGEAYEDWNPRDDNERTIRDSENGLENMDFDQDSETEVDPDQNNPHRQLGALGAILGSLIAGTSNPDRALESVQSSEIIDARLKEMIMKVVEDEKGRLSRGPKFDPIVNDDEDINEFTSLNEGKQRLVRDFKRYI